MDIYPDDPTTREPTALDTPEPISDAAAADRPAATPREPTAPHIDRQDYHADDLAYWKSLETNDYASQHDDAPRYAGSTAIAAARGDDPRKRPVTEPIGADGPRGDTPAAPESAEATEVADGPRPAEAATALDADLERDLHTLETAFEPYRERAREIFTQIRSGGVSLGQIEGFVSAEGSTSVVYEMPDGTLLKLQCQPELDPERQTHTGLPDPDTTREEYVIPLLRGRGSAGFEQIVAGTEALVSNEGEVCGAVVVERAPGKAWENMTRAEKEAVPLAHVEQLLETCSEAAERHIVPDYGTRHLFHHPEKSFTQVDYNTPEYERVEPATAEDIALQWASGYNLIDSREVEDSQLAQHVLTAVRARFGEAAAEQLATLWRHEAEWERLEAAYGNPPDIPLGGVTPEQPSELPVETRYDTESGRLHVRYDDMELGGAIRLSEFGVPTLQVGLGDLPRLGADWEVYLVRQLARQAAFHGIEAVRVEHANGRELEACNAAFGGWNLTYAQQDSDGYNQAAAMDIREAEDIIGFGRTPSQIDVHVDLLDPDVRRMLDLPALPVSPDADVDAREQHAELNRQIEELETDFAPYRDQATRIFNQLRSGQVRPEDIEGFISGDSSSSYVYETADGKILKLQCRPDYDLTTRSYGELPSPDTTRKIRFIPLLRAKGQEGYEQIVAGTERLVSDTGEVCGAVVVERAPGKPWLEMTMEERSAVPLEHLEQLMRSCATTAERDLDSDQHPRHLFYDPEAAFTQIDFQTKGAHWNYLGPTTVEQVACGWAIPMDPIGDPNSRLHQNIVTAMRTQLGDASANEFTAFWKGIWVYRAENDTTGTVTGTDSPDAH
ncbi:MAG TPA: hypothetical protein VLF91_05805 [Candidatus Saccharimonadales bacterium]|nr:hypothetical protein [Candidatus Saccharimonadales bacterium]